jgi:MFS transporter, putative metabolite:H+ symporter
MGRTQADLETVGDSVDPGMDRLPTAPVYRKIAWLLAFVFFFEFGDINTFSFVAPAILHTWGLTISTISLVMSATFVGMFAGATAVGWISDRIGRKRTLLISTVWFSAASLLNAFVWEPIGLSIARTLTGVGVSAMTVVGVTYISEIFPAQRRGAYQAWILAAGLAGIPATAYVARFCIPLAPWGWRLVFLWGALALAFPMLASQIEESPHWLEVHGPPENTLAVLRGILVPAASQVGHSAAAGSRSGQIGHSSYATLFSRLYLGRSLLLVLAWVCQTLGFYGFMSWVPTLLVARDVSLVQTLAWSSAMHLGAVPGALIGAAISDRWQRKWWIVIIALAVAICGLAYGLTDLTDVVVIFGFSVVLLIHAFAALLYSYTAECYPTEIRSSGTGLTYGIGRLANVFGPLVVSLLFQHYGYVSVFLYIAACWMTVSITVALFGPSPTVRSRRASQPAQSVFLP